MNRTSSYSGDPFYIFPKYKVGLFLSYQNVGCRNPKSKYDFVGYLSRANHFTHRKKFFSHKSPPATSGKKLTVYCPQLAANRRTYKNTPLPIVLYNKLARLGGGRGEPSLRKQKSFKKNVEKIYNKFTKYFFLKL
jgi:hypothetical protein